MIVLPHWCLGAASPAQLERTRTSPQGTHSGSRGAARGWPARPGQRRALPASVAHTCARSSRQARAAQRDATHAAGRDTRRMAARTGTKARACTRRARLGRNTVATNEARRCGRHWALHTAAKPAQGRQRARGRARTSSGCASPTAGPGTRRAGLPSPGTRGRCPSCPQLSSRVCTARARARARVSAPAASPASPRQRPGKRAGAASPARGARAGEGRACGWTVAAGPYHVCDLKTTLHTDGTHVRSKRNPSVKGCAMLPTAYTAGVYRKLQGQLKRGAGEELHADAAAAHAPTKPASGKPPGSRAGSRAWSWKQCLQESCTVASPPRAARAPAPSAGAPPTPLKSASSPLHRLHSRTVTASCRLLPMESACGAAAGARQEPLRCRWSQQA